jgi:conjugative transposon TraN protein
MEPEGAVTFPNELMNAAHLESYSKGILDNPAFINGIKDKRWDILGEVTGIYIKDKVVFYQFTINNQSPLDYDIYFIRFYIRDKRKGKRTASQELELKPLYSVGNIKTVKANDRNSLVFAMEKFTVPDAKYFLVQVGEKNGGRHLTLKIRNGKLLKAKTLPSYY